MATPLFIVGHPRTGTTWIANMLCNHSKIGGVQAERHFGIHESGFFAYILDRFGDLRNHKNYIQLVEIFASSDYFILSGLDKEILYKKWTENYYKFFEIFMDTYAKVRRKDFFLEKTPFHTLYLPELSQHYQDAKFIAIKRDLIDSLSSHVKIVNPKHRKSYLVWKTLTYVMYYKIIEEFSKKHPEKIMLIEYKTMRESERETTEKMCDFLDLQFENQMLEQRYKPDTAFHGINKDKNRQKTLTPTEKKMAEVLKTFFNLFPSRLYDHLANSIKEHVKHIELPDSFWTIQIEKLSRHVKAGDESKRYW